VSRDGVYPFCPKCGEGNAGKTKFCTACGDPLAVREQTLHGLSATPCSGCEKTSPRSPWCRWCGERHEATILAPVYSATPLQDVSGRSMSLSAGATAAMGSVGVTMADGTRGPTYPISLVGLTIVGRTEGQMTFPDDSHMSPRHLDILGKGEKVLASDVNSLNGVYVRILEPKVVPAGTTILIGRQYFRVRPMELRPPVSDPEGTMLVGSDAPAVLWALERLMTTGMVRDTYALPGPHLTIGRHSTDIQFPHDTFVSGKHAKLEPRENGVRITDLDSSNGTWYRLTEPTLLAHGAQLMIGGTRLTLMLPHS